MSLTLSGRLSEADILLADGATGTNFFNMGLMSGDAPELWNMEAPEKVKALHRSFVDAGADIILTNTFGGTASRLKLHDAHKRVHELNREAAQLASEVAQSVDRPVLVAGSVGPTGELFEPLGALTHEEAVRQFREQMEALKEGGAHLIWIETMSAREEIVAAAEAAIATGLEYVFTASFDTAGRTMMGIAPAELPAIAGELDTAPVACGANCGVGATDLLFSVLDMTAQETPIAVVAKANCGVPKFVGEEIVYTGTPELMADYAKLAIDAGARIIGGCCGTSPEHLAAMRRAIDEHVKGERPSHEKLVAGTGELVNKIASGDAKPERARRGGRRRG